MKRGQEDSDEEDNSKRSKVKGEHEDDKSDEDHEAHENHLAGEPLIDEDYVDDITASGHKAKVEKTEDDGPSIRVDASRVQLMTPDRKIPANNNTNTNTKGKEKDHGKNGGCVVYWMSRDQRVNDNWALLYAQEKAHELKVPLVVVFNLVPVFLNAAFRAWSFLISGLQEIQKTLHKHKIPFILLQGEPHETIPKFVEENHVLMVVADFNPLRISKKWKQDLIKNTSIPIYQVDAHNVVPVWTASNKQETAARTLRPKIHRVLSKFPEVQDSKIEWKGKEEKIPWDEILEDFRTRSDIECKPITWIKPGESAARAHLTQFVTKRMKGYADNRNDPTKDAQSNLSPYIHFGSLASQRIILEAKKHKASAPGSYESFLEELVVRKELADNFCYYNANYDNFDGFPQWAKDSLNLHAKDKRDHLYTFEQLEKSKTYDRLWNAAQTQMVNTGKMHGFMRMYWGKKILEWTKSPQEAMDIAVKLNDRYEIDGRDPNGYVGCAWSIGGVHDQGWKERPVFGKVRYMNFEGCKRKFNVEAYITKYLKLCK